MHPRALWCGLALALPLAAQSEPLQITFTGHIEALNPQYRLYEELGRPDLILPGERQAEDAALGKFKVGATVQVSYTFDTSTFQRSDEYAFDSSSPSVPNGSRFTQAERIQTDIESPDSGLSYSFSEPGDGGSRFIRIQSNGNNGSYVDFHVVNTQARWDHRVPAAMYEAFASFNTVGDNTLWQEHDLNTLLHSFPFSQGGFGRIYAYDPGCVATMGFSCGYAEFSISGAALTSAVPEPSSGALWLLGGVSLWRMVRRRAASPQA